MSANDLRGERYDELPASFRLSLAKWAKLPREKRDAPVAKLAKY